MSREHESAAKTAGGPGHDATRSTENTSAGKHPTTQDAAQPADAAEPRAASATATVPQLMKTVREKYLPSVHKYKDLAIEEMRTSFTQTEQAGASFLGLAIKGVAAGAGAALATAAGGGLLVTALSAGAFEAASGIASSFGNKGNIAPNEFCSRYGSRLQRHWYQVSDHVLAAMKDQDSAHEIHERMKSLYDHDGVVRREMREELLDAWTNALRYKTMNPSGGVGSKSFNDPTEGRLHLGSFDLDIEDKKSPPRTTTSTIASMPGVPGQEARNVDLHRRLDDMQIARTVRVHWSGYGVHGDVNFGVAPGAKDEIDQLGADTSIDRFAMASYYVGKRLDRDDASIFEGPNDQKKIDANWHFGMRHIWGVIRDKSLAQLNIKSIGTKD